MIYFETNNKIKIVNMSRGPSKVSYKYLFPKRNNVNSFYLYFPGYPHSADRLFEYLSELSVLIGEKL